MNLYEVLGINTNASEKEIKKAYHKLSLLYHPDKNKDPKAKEKYQNIQTAYQILINPDTRSEYCKLNHIDQNNFVDLLQKIFKDSLVLEEIKHFGIHFEKNDWKYLEKNFQNLLCALNFKELLIFFKEGKFPKKKIDTNLSITDTDNEHYDDTNSEVYFHLPIYYQRINNLDINLNLNITITDLLQNNKKKIKIKRTINNNIIYNTFLFSLDKPFIIFPNCGDVQNDFCGNLIIKLNLPNNFFWDENIIIVEQQISLYEMIYGLDINLNMGEQNIRIPNWSPCRDGFFIDINQIKIKTFILSVKLVLNYEHTPEKEKLLLEFFS
jgi:curved DNA-binding protein CbpA